MPRVVPFSSLDEPVGRYPTVSTTPGTSSSRKQKEGDKRTVRLRLLPSGAQERRLRRIADATAKLWNELNYARLMQFRESDKIDFKGTGVNSTIGSMRCLVLMLGR